MLCFLRQIRESIVEYLVYLKYWVLNLRPLMVYPKVRVPPNFTIWDCAPGNLDLNVLCVLRQIRESIVEYLVYLKYWVLNLRPLMVYPKVLVPPNFTIWDCAPGNLDLKVLCFLRQIRESIVEYLVYLKYWVLNLGPLMVYPKVLVPPNFTIWDCAPGNLDLNVLCFLRQIRESVVEYAEAKVRNVKERRGLADLQLTFLRGSIFGHPSLPVMGKFDRIHVGANCPKLRLRDLLRLLKPGLLSTFTARSIYWDNTITKTRTEKCIL